MTVPASDLLGRFGRQEISHRIKAQARTLYLVEGHNPAQIEAAGIGLTAKQISQLASREGWTEKRKRAAAAIEETSIARADKAVADVAEAIAIESEELCFSALRETRAGLTEGGLNGAKQAQAASSTLRNLAGVAKILRDPGASDPAGQGSVNFNVFFANPGAKAEPKAVESQQVTDV